MLLEARCGCRYLNWCATTAGLGASAGLLASSHVRESAAASAAASLLEILSRAVVHSRRTGSEQQQPRQRPPQHQGQLT